MSSQNNSNAEEQNNVMGQKKEVNVTDYPYTTELANLLKDMEYPANKNKILDFIKSAGNTDNTIVELIEKIEDIQCNNSAEVINSTGLVER